MPTKQRTTAKGSGTRKPSPKKRPDLAFRPVSYWKGLGPLQVLLGPIKEEHRRRRILDALRTGDTDLPEGILEPEFPEGFQKALEQIHPSFMGGAYLPSLEPEEVEIARICLASTTSDVISLRASLGPEGGIDYRVVDEYETEFDLPMDHSDQPLTLGEVFKVLDETDGYGEDPGLLTSFIVGPLREGEDPDDYRSFVTVESTFYSELGACCEAHIQSFLDDFEASR